METKEISMPTVKDISGSPSEIIREGISKGMDLDKLKGLLELQERWEANQAKKAYHQAMAAFKANQPVILKDRKVSYLNVKYSHASLGEASRKINPELCKYGLYASWIPNQQGDRISITCRITHEMGHSEEATLSGPEDHSGSKNPMQAIGSSAHYLERYTLFAVLGIAPENGDTDAIIEVEKVTLEEVAQLLVEVQDRNIDLGKFLTYMGIKEMKDMPKSELQRAKIAIEAKKK